MERVLAGKSTRITVDLGNPALVKEVRIAAVEQGRSVRDIVVEALTLWLAGTALHDKKAGQTAIEKETSADKDYLTMMETLNRYRGGEGK